MSASPRRPDPDKLKEFAKHVFGALEGAMTFAMIYLGDRLGLYRALWRRAPLTSEELAARTGLHERWLREWLYAAGRRGHARVHRRRGRFALDARGRASCSPTRATRRSAAGCSRRCRRRSRWSSGCPRRSAAASDSTTTRSARGRRAGVERGFAPWYRALLVPMALPRVAGVVPALERGARVADVGCGARRRAARDGEGVPDARDFHGYDISQHALARAEANRRAAGVDNVAFHDARREPLPDDASFDFVTTFDCLHDMTDPGARRCGDPRARSRDDGTWLIADIKARDSYEAERAPTTRWPR